MLIGGDAVAVGRTPCVAWASVVAALARFGDALGAEGVVEFVRLWRPFFAVEEAGSVVVDARGAFAVLGAIGDDALGKVVVGLRLLGAIVEARSVVDASRPLAARRRAACAAAFVDANVVAMVIHLCHVFRFDIDGIVGGFCGDLSIRRRLYKCIVVDLGRKGCL